MYYYVAYRSLIQHAIRTASTTPSLFMKAAMIRAACKLAAGICIGSWSFLLNLSDLVANIKIQNLHGGPPGTLKLQHNHKILKEHASNIWGRVFAGEKKCRSTETTGRVFCRKKVPAGAQISHGEFVLREKVPVGRLFVTLGLCLFPESVICTKTKNPAGQRFRHTGYVFFPESDISTKKKVPAGRRFPHTGYALFLF